VVCFVSPSVLSSVTEMFKKNCCLLSVPLEVAIPFFINPMGSESIVLYRPEQDILLRKVINKLEIIFNNLTALDVGNFKSTFTSKRKVFEG